VVQKACVTAASITDQNNFLNYFIGTLGN